MKNSVEVREDTAAIVIRRKDGTVVKALVDTDDLPKLRRFGGTWWAKWYEDIQNYRISAYVPGSGAKNQRKVYLHRLLLDAPVGLQVDHINHNTLDNRRCNLRLVTAEINQQNRKGPSRVSTTGVRGVHRHTSSGLFAVRFKCNHRVIRLGYFRELSDAANAAREFLANESVTPS